jgi:hypothetical protein
MNTINKKYQGKKQLKPSVQMLLYQIWDENNNSTGGESNQPNVFINDEEFISKQFFSQSFVFNKQ